MSSKPPPDANPYAAPHVGSAEAYVPHHQGFHRGGTILALGICSAITALLTSSCFCCMPLGMMVFLATAAFAVPAVFMGHRDLADMRRGAMDIEGRGTTLAGLVLAYIALALILLQFIAGIALFIFAIMVDAPAS